MSKLKSNHFFLFSKAKETIFNVSEACEKEQKPGLRSFLDQRLEVAGAIRNTVDCVQKEKKDTGMLLFQKNDC